MNNRLLFLSLLASLSVVTPTLAQANPSKSQVSAPAAAYFRYYDENNRQQISQMVSENHLKFGYEELDSRMQVIRKVAPRPTAADLERLAEAKIQREKDRLQKQDDAKLLRLYATARDAEVARDRQLAALQLKIDFNRNALQRLNAERAKETQRAANVERTGKPVPKNILEEIDKLDGKIADIQKLLQQRREEQELVRAEYTPTIERIRYLKGLSGSSAQ